MTGLEQLLALEEIEKLKARYFVGLDTQDWDLWRREVWAPDARLEMPEIDTSWEGAEKIIEMVARTTNSQVTVHHGHMPIIDFQSGTEATGIWAMVDWMWRTAPHPFMDDWSRLLGFGHYHERYEKLDIGWRIRTTRLTRLRVEMDLMTSALGEAA